MTIGWSVIIVKPAVIFEYHSETKDHWSNTERSQIRSQRPPIIDPSGPCSPIWDQQEWSNWSLVTGVICWMIIGPFLINVPLISDLSVVSHGYPQNQVAWGPWKFLKIQIFCRCFRKKSVKTLRLQPCSSVPISIGITVLSLSPLCIFTTIMLILLRSQRYKMDFPFLLKKFFWKIHSSERAPNLFSFHLSKTEKKIWEQISGTSLIKSSLWPWRPWWSIFNFIEFEYGTIFIQKLFFENLQLTAEVLNI